MAEDLAALAAIVARQSLDLDVYAAFLLESMQQALPAEYVTVRRRGSLFRRDRAPVEEVSVLLGEQRFTLTRSSGTRAIIGHEVRGIVLKSEPVPLDQWAHRLASALAELVRGNEAAAAALARITAMEV